MKTYLDYITDVTSSDAAGLFEAEKQYGDSWKQGGGVSAWFMLKRKWDRMLKALGPKTIVVSHKEYTPAKAAELLSTGLAAGPVTETKKRLLGEILRLLSHQPWDIFAAIAADKRPEGIIDDIRDLRRYLVLVEAEMIARGELEVGNHRDNKSRPVDQPAPYGYDGEVDND